MRVSVAPESRHGLCSACHLAGMITIFTIMVGTSLESTPPLCAGCLRNQEEVTVDLEPPPPPQTTPPGRRVRKASQRQERRIAEAVGGRTQPGSGNQPGAKGDVRKRGEFRIEAKTSFSNQYILTRSTLDKIRGECDRAEKPALVLDFADKITHRRLDSWTVIPTSHWETLINAPGQDL